MAVGIRKIGGRFEFDIDLVRVRPILVDLSRSSDLRDCLFVGRRTCVILTLSVVGLA